MSTPSNLESNYAAHHATHGRYGYSYRLEERGPRFATWIGTGQRVLDLGCRDGSLTCFYVSGNTVTGVDIDQDALALAREQLGVETAWLDLNCTPFAFADGSFTAVVAGELLEHLVHPTAVVKEAWRILTPGGVFIGSVPNSFHWRARWDFLRGHSDEDPTHLHLFSLTTLRALLEEFGEVEVLPVGGIGGRALPVLPRWLARSLVRRWPSGFANDFLFRAVKRMTD